MKIDNKIHARRWIIGAIQNHSWVPSKETEREIRRFLGRLQRDIRQLEKARNRMEKTRVTNRKEAAALH